MFTFQRLKEQTDDVSIGLGNQKDITDSPFSRPIDVEEILNEVCSRIN